MRSILLVFSLFIGVSTFGQLNDTIYKSFSDTTFFEGDKILAPEIIFTMSGLKMQPEYHDSITVISDFLEKYPSIKIEIGVHTDSRGSSNMNLKLSERRASFVKQELVNTFGIEPDRINSNGYGESAPIIMDEQIEKSNSNEKKEALYAKNRRIELTIIDV